MNAQSVRGPEVSAGGVVLRKRDDTWEVAVIRPRGRAHVLALPKGHIDPGEEAAVAAAREVEEETGLSVDHGHALGEVRYSYLWRGQTVFKVVHFFAFVDPRGQIDQLQPVMRREVDQARWLPAPEAQRALSYPGEREMVDRALAWLAQRHDVGPGDDAG